MRFDAESKPGRDVDDILVPLVLDALDCTDTVLMRAPRTSLEPDPLDRSTVHWAERSVTTTWRNESSTGRVRVERTYTYFPGDVNEPMRESEDVVVHAALEGKPTVVLRATVGERAMSIDIEVSPTRERILERILERLQSTFGRW